MGSETGVFRLTENGSGRIVTGETGLAHTRAGTYSQLLLSIVRVYLISALAQLDIGHIWAGWWWWLSYDVVELTNQLAAASEGWAHSYPLSMTNAATSSVKRKTVSNEFEGDGEVD